MDTVTIGINGMSCGHCVAAVRKALESVAGVRVEAVQIGSATVAIDPAVTSRAAVDAAIDAAGYDVVSGRVLNIAAASKSGDKSDA
jgi:copper chaperone CopZ